jgi:pantothenate kinase type III
MVTMRTAFDDTCLDALKRLLENLANNNSLKPTINTFVSIDVADTLLEHLNEMIDKYFKYHLILSMIYYSLSFFFYLKHA